MKTIKSAALALLLVLAGCATAPPRGDMSAGGGYYGEISAETGRRKDVYVRGYYRRDGTYVRPHYRSRPRR